MIKKRALMATCALLCALAAACDDGATSGRRSSMGGDGPDATAEYRETPEAASKGERLFVSQACSRCHTGTETAIGPPLFDGTWRYGSAPDSIYASIMHGRPGGMAPFRGRLNAEEVWSLVAYLRTGRR